MVGVWWSSPGLERGNGTNRAGETQNWKGYFLEGGSVKAFGTCSSLVRKDVECDPISGGNCSVMERIPSTAAFIGHAFQTMCLMFLLAMSQFCRPRPKGYGQWQLITLPWYTQMQSQCLAPWIYRREVALRLLVVCELHLWSLRYWMPRFSLPQRKDYKTTNFSLLVLGCLRVFWLY